MRSKALISCLILVIAFISGCSFLVDLVFFNNSDRNINVCNLNLRVPACVNIKPRSLEKIQLVADKPGTAWHFSIDNGKVTKTVSFPNAMYPELASEIYCEGILQKMCDIPIQYQPDGLLYWGGRSNELPTKNLANQPRFFPIEPSA